MQHPWGHPQMAQGNSLLRPGGQFVQGQPQAGSPRVGAPRQAPTNMQQPAGAVAGRPLQRTHSPVRQVHPNQAAMPHSGLVAGMHGAQMPGSLAAGRCPAAPVNSSGCKAHPLPAACPQRLRAPSFSATRGETAELVFDDLWICRCRTMMRAWWVKPAAEGTG
jgi:hypothetical protein